MKNKVIKSDGILWMALLFFFIGMSSAYGYAISDNSSFMDKSDVQANGEKESLTVKETGQSICKDFAASVVLDSLSSKNEKSRWNLKTNLPFWGILWMNAAVEYKLSDNWSVDLSVYYNPVRYARSFTMKTFMIQPSLRYWFLPEMTGHFWGVHLATSIYNVAVDNEIRYQDSNYPLLGIGVDYGYALHFNDCWGMEFNVGIGYMHTHYETFYNVENGSRISSGYYNYFGITRAGVSLIYRF